MTGHFALNIPFQNFVDNWFCLMLDQIILWLGILMQTIDPVAHWIKLLCKLKFVSETDNWSCPFMLDQIILYSEVWCRQLILLHTGSNYSTYFNISASSPIYWSFLSLEIEWSKFTGHLALMFIKICCVSIHITSVVAVPAVILNCFRDTLNWGGWGQLTWIHILT